MTQPAKQRVSVIGAGAWGTALARHVAEKQLPVCLWAYESDVVESIEQRRENHRYLPGVALPSGLSATTSLEEALAEADYLVFAVPSHVARAVLRRMAPLLSLPLPLISATKGIEEETLQLMTQVMQEELPAAMQDFLLVLSGPSFAAEVSQGQPTAISLAGLHADLVKQTQSLFMTPSFRVYADDDVIGVQLGGALKNVMALAAGVVDGLELGHNARAALITRGLAEMIRLGAAMGADPRTFYGLSGVGDLILTCTGPLSRNHSVGMRLGRGEGLAAILGSMQAVAEGVRTAKAALGLARRYDVDMPIVQEVNAVLFAEKSCRQAVGDLMEREAKGEKALS
ncbi:MAG: Glycerol-3-phosphate dehydrogenase [NAD(P)+] [Nitrospirae bacterium]|nr:MAG: glycerol-3-phosphate dehydrogenase [Nitrospira sp. OLB3]MBV6470103.1 Glycerol-3-phosphate dehydrogenase [NAD(P)+] [Nitrospirota bacterium]MCE7964998.1 NAD(P)-dependent glycerol-3-phosphate dehydrogenase [Nitrospira sp. NTP2]MCK6492972.1 NAD(P)-dependent glycerol-3-phosphate dehydrogenase [Nitrospira sp.]MEB2337932.1 NAD(P)-dependent glycerol-3-phosphate dehydrogenase [Nitrospirales bacterium]